MLRDTWKFTKRQYTTYLNTPATLNMNARGNWEPYELALGEAVFTIDNELQRLVRAMENSDHNPDQDWVLSMIGRFPWLSGVALVDRAGALIAQYPEHFAKPFDATPLIEPDPRQRPGDLRAYAQLSPAGPEIYIANPVYGSGAEVLRGLIVSYFDPRLLATMTHDPGSFMLVSPAGVLWHGQYGPNSITVVEAQDWADMLRRRSHGLIGNKREGYFWTTRYVGNLPIVYVISVSATPTFSTERSPSFFGNWRRSAPAQQPEPAHEPVGPAATSQAIPEADFVPPPEMPAPDVPHRMIP
jgi:hypothetical protein